MDIREIFENALKIEPKVVSIESLFNNPDRINKTNYKPSYQRNYVWDDEKASYFIESIFIGTEIPPLIFFRNSDKIEVIDGRQRYETILRFINNEFKLKKSGLQKLDNIGIANRLFRDISQNLQDLFWDTKLRLIEFSFHSPKLVDEESEESVKREIFKRYNSGITPLKPTEIDKAYYFEDDLNTFLKFKLQNDKILYRDITSLLHFEKTSDEIILKKIRQLLVQHRIPIKYYAVKKDTVISKYYEFLFANIQESEVAEIYRSFIEKINLIGRIKTLFPKSAYYNRLITECLFWAFSIMEAEGLALERITENVIIQLLTYIHENLDAFSMVRHSFSKELFTRYEITANFFSKLFDIDFSIYLLTTVEFKKENQELDVSGQEMVSFDELRINKPEPSSTAIMDITRSMERQRFLIRPPYQRDEVINRRKSSSIIESILLGIKLPPIFVYKRSDGISEVLDGQQRLLSILGFLQKPYLDEKNALRYSNKNGYALHLKNSILSNLHGKKFDQLTPEHQEKIKNFDLWIIEISYRNNVNFEPIDLFIRLNNKPYPIKEDTFELWNSYISRDIIDTIKTVHQNNMDWFYIRKNNSRMENENFYTTLAYFIYSKNLHATNSLTTLKELDIYLVGQKINFRVRSKNEITKVLESSELKDKFIEAINELEFEFIRKVKTLLSDQNGRSSSDLSKNLDEIFRIEKGKRTQQGFWALWHFLCDIPLTKIAEYKNEIKQSLRSLFANINHNESKQHFDDIVTTFKERFVAIDQDRSFLNQSVASLGEIAHLSSGATLLNLSKSGSTLFHSTIPFLRKGEFENFQIKKDGMEVYSVDNSDKPIFFLQKKILIKKHSQSNQKLAVAYVEDKLAFGPDIFGVVVLRSGILTKYVLAALGSTAIYNWLMQANSSEVDEPKPLTINELRDLPIPVISLDRQRIIANVLDYLYHSSTVSQITLFFDTVLGTMVAESYFPDVFKGRSISIIDKLSDIEVLENHPKNNWQQIINDTYSKVSAPTHPLTTELVKFVASQKEQSMMRVP